MKQSLEVELEKCCFEVLLNSNFHILYKGRMDFLVKVPNIKVVVYESRKFWHRFQLIWSCKTWNMAILVKTVQIKLYCVVWFITRWKRLILKRYYSWKLLWTEWTSLCINLMVIGVIFWEICLCKVDKSKLPDFGKQSF